MANLNKRRREFESYATAKANEIEEQRLSWRYYHSDQLTADQLRVLKKRGQPPMVFDRTSRKIDGLVGTVRRLRTDPKAYPRTLRQEEGAEVATQVIRTICDQSNFEDLETEAARDGAVHGIAVSELEMIQGDQGDPDFKFSHHDPRTFFYDPRSLKPDFSDARFQGIYKWVGLDELDEIVPGAADIVSAADDGTYFTAFDTDREVLWVDEKQRYRLVDHWYIEGGAWRWCLHVGSAELMSGDGWLINQYGKSMCKYFAFANQIDADGDHYGFVRRLKGPQDAMNQHRSKAMHIMNTRGIIARKGSFAEEDGGLNGARQQVQRPDFALEYTGERADFEIWTPDQEFLQQTQYYQDAKGEIETFGPNQALLGDLGQSASGRAYAMAQQAGLAELGPFLKNYRSWKLAQYEAAWFAARRYWTSERLIRVTDDEGLAQFLQVNGLEQGPYGQPMLVNALGEIDVDIVISEGPDTETVMGDVFDTLTALAQNKVPVPPQVIIETSNLPGDVKKKLTGMMSQPDPMKEQAARLEIEGKALENQETGSRAMLNVAKARSEGMPDAPAQPQQQEFELPPEIQIGQAVAEIMETRASAADKEASANKKRVETALAPRQMAIESAHRSADREIASRRPQPAH